MQNISNIRRASLICKLSAIFFCFSFSLSVSASERILYFGSRIEVNKNGSLHVTETIKVNAEGDQIKHGIFRAFPTRYKDRYGNKVNVIYEVLQVTQDGNEANYFVRPEGNAFNVYIGDQNSLVEPGVHTYVIVYSVPQQVGFFTDFDEIYWNVTGNEWAFAIDSAEATVVLPPGAKATRKAAYSGSSGATGCDCSVIENADGTVHVVTTTYLFPHQGLTIGIGWPKGFVAEPTAQEKFQMLMMDNRYSLICLCGLVLAVLYYSFAWWRVGRDPDEGTIIPLFAPPDGFTPAPIRFVWQMGFDKKAFAASVVNMAVKGYIRIEEKDDEYTLHKISNNNSALSKAEQRAATELFCKGSSIVVSQDNYLELGAAVEALKKAMKQDFEKIYFNTNYLWLVPGVLITLLTLFVNLSYATTDATRLMPIWLSIWTIGCTTLVMKVISKWKEVGGLMNPGSGAALRLTIFAVPFVLAEFFVLNMFASLESPLSALALFLLIVNNGIFYHLMKAPTLTGAKILAQIEGFRMYLNVAEKDRINMLNPPERTPALFEKLLPYAIALDAEEAWGSQFSAVMAHAIQHDHYSPTWYSGNMSMHNFNPGTFSSSLGSSFNSSLSSSSMAPGSSSGSGGGGSSGGGGGGGGGGGW